MNFEFPHHLRRQFALVISASQNAVGWEATKAYLSLLSHDAESTVSEPNSNTHNLATQCANNKSSDAAEET
jgi:hypothetical protein